MTDKITLANVTTFANDSTAVALINNNNAAITAAMDNTLSLNGLAPNLMQSNLDMNNNQILNLPSPATVDSPARLIDVTSNPTIVVPPVGTSGAVVGLLNANKTDSGNNTFTGTNTLTGAILNNPTITNPTYTLPTIQQFTSGSGTYTTPANAKYLLVEMVGGGAGGGGSSVGGLATAQTAGSATTFGSSFLSAGGGGVVTNNYQTGNPGTASGGDLNLTGNYGQQGMQNSSASAGQCAGGAGGSSYFGGCGVGGSIGGTSGGPAVANSGSGGGGASQSTVNNGVSGAGGSSGGYCRKLIRNPNPTYAYAVGAGGAGGATGATQPGGNGAGGQIIVYEYYI